MASLAPNTSPLGVKFARHLIRRTTFTYTKPFIDQIAILTPSEAMDVLFQDLPLTLALPYDPLPAASPDGFWTESALPHTTFLAGTRKQNFVVGWWWYNAIHTPSIQFKMSHFLSTRFTIEKNNGNGTATEFYDHMRLLLFFATGNYKTLAQKMTLDNSMLQYLDNNDNNKNSPNENYAREFFELFTIGKGPQIAPGNYTNYTEEDIVQAAKVLTGFKRDIDRDVLDNLTGIPKGRNGFLRHDTNPKTFSSAFGNQVISPASDASEMDTELDVFIEMIFNQIETAKHICRKIYIYFVRGTISSEIENDIITPLALELRANNYELEPTLRRLFTSVHFYDLDDANMNDEIIGGIVKSPLQQISEIATYFQMTIPDPNTEQLFYFQRFWKLFVEDTYMKGANMNLFEPDNVAGHQAYFQAPDFDKSWISGSTLIARYKLGICLLDGANRIKDDFNIYSKIQILDVIETGNIVSNAFDPFVLVGEICKAIFGQEPDNDRINYFVNSFLLDGNPGYNWSDAWSTYLNTNDFSVVEPRLNLLISKILSTPESQLF